MSPENAPTNSNITRDGIQPRIMAFPLFVLAMGIVAALGNSVLNIILATMIINLPFYCRFARAEVNVRRELGYVEAARMGGNTAPQTLVSHIIPNILPPMMVQASLNMGWATLNAAGLSFIGLGVRPPTPEWGIMVSEGASYIISGEWWAFMFPGAALVAAVFTFNMLGDGLRDKVESWTPGQQTIFTRFDEWKSGPLPKLKRVIYKQIPSAGTRRALLEKGDVDMSVGLPPKDYAELARLGKVQVIGVPVQNDLVFIDMNVKIAPFDNPKVREAISYAIPYKEIIESALYNRAKPMFGGDPSKPYPAGVWPVPIRHRISRRPSRS
jgi:Bacterial extracellular solute-binding proteins, family 5 Middle/Binding-protein-dependent transport system inner membrane component